MMADNTQILREYLMSLGFRVNATEHKKFTNTLGAVTKQAGMSATALIGVATAATTMVTSYAAQMEKLYYSTRRTGATVAQMQQLRFAGKQVGLGAEEMSGAVESFAKMLRTQPGLMGAINRFGVKTGGGRTAADMMLDLVDKLKEMPYSQGSKWAEMFGMDEGTYQILAQNTDKIREQMKIREEMDRKTGTNADENAKAMVAWNKQVDVLTEKYELLKGKVAINLLPVFIKLTEQAGAFIDKFITGGGLSTEIEQLKGLAQFLSGDLAGARETWKKGAEDSIARDEADPDTFKKKIGGWLQAARESIIGYGHGGREAGRRMLGGSNATPAVILGPSTNGGGRPGLAEKKAMLAELEKQYDLPSGVLYALWKQESNLGTDPRMNDPYDGSSSRGDFQMIKSTREAYGISDPNNFSQNAVGAAEMMANLMRDSKGNLRTALSMWNGGYPGSPHLGTDANDRFTNQVMRKIEQHNKFEIHGSNAKDIANAVANKLNTANQQLTSNMRGAVQ